MTHVANASTLADEKDTPPQQAQTTQSSPQQQQQRSSQQASHNDHLAPYITIAHQFYYYSYLHQQQQKQQQQQQQQSPLRAHHVRFATGTKHTSPRKKGKGSITSMQADHVMQNALSYPRYYQHPPSDYPTSYVPNGYHHHHQQQQQPLQAASVPYALDLQRAMAAATYSPRPSSYSKSFSIESILGLNNPNQGTAINDAPVSPILHQYPLQHHHEQSPTRETLDQHYGARQGARGSYSPIKDVALRRRQRYESTVPYPQYIHHQSHPHQHVMSPSPPTHMQQQQQQQQPLQHNPTNQQQLPASQTRMPIIEKGQSKTNISPDESPSKNGKGKRVRTIFTPDQLEKLEAQFDRQQYMVGPERQDLAGMLNLSEAQVKVWFQNRRIKWRKQSADMQQARLAKLKEAADNSPPEEESTESSSSEETE